MATRGFDAATGATSDNGYTFTMEEIHVMADTDATGCPPKHIPLWLRDYGDGLEDLAKRLDSGDHDCGMNDLLHLRSRLLRRHRELARHARRYGYHARTVAWFVRYE